MSVEWKLICAAAEVDDTFAALDITAASVDLQSCAVDAAVLEWKPDLGSNAADLLPYNAVCRIDRDDVPFFSGRCRTNPRAAVNPEETIRYDILGPWFDLERAPYEQRWMIWDAATETSTWQRKGRLILGQAENGSAMTVGQIIADVVAYAAVKGARVALPASTAGWPAIKFPWEEIANLKCADVIIRCMAMIPNWKCRFDYTQATPVFDLVQRSAATAVSFAVGTADITEIGSVATRHDLACPGVRIKFERSHSYEGEGWESIEEQESGDPDDLDAIDATLPLAGMNITTQSVRIVSEILPVAGDPEEIDWLNLDWWKGQVAALNDLQNIELVSCTQEVQPPADGGDTADIGALDRMLIDGTCPEWLGGAVVADVILNLVCNYTEKREADDKTVAKVKEHKISHRLTLTNVPTGVYNRTGGDYAEPAPTGFAAALYASWSPLQYEGSFALELEECSHIIRPGDALNVTGSYAAWATMAAHVQQVRHEIETGHVTIVIGPAKRMDPATLLSLMRRLRARQLPVNHLSRTTGKTADRGNNVQQGGKDPDKQTTATPGSHAYLSIGEYDPDDPFTKEIELDPDAIIPSDADDRTDPIVIKPREVRVAVMDGDTTGKIIRVQTLVSESYDQPGASATPAADGFMLVPKPAGDNPGILAYHPGVGLVWVYAATARQPLQRGSGATLEFDWVRAV